MRLRAFLHTIDRISTFVGKATAWLIVVLMVVVCVEVFKRYILRSPTAWIYDFENMLYGTAFMLCGAYALAQNAHVRGDFLYGSMRPRTQASLDLFLYLLFFIPGIAALIYAGYLFRSTFLEHQRAFQHHGGWSAALLLQVHDAAGRRAGDAAGGRRDRALRRLHQDRRVARPAQGRDQEIDVVEEQLAESEHVDEETRKRAIARAHEIEEMARQRGLGGDIKT